MPPFDPIASSTVRAAAHREPAFVFPAQAAGAERRLADFVARTGRRPNILFILFDDVGWGDFGCYGGGVAVGALSCWRRTVSRAGSTTTTGWWTPSPRCERASTSGC